MFYGTIEIDIYTDKFVYTLFPVFQNVNNEL